MDENELYDDDMPPIWFITTVMSLCTIVGAGFIGVLIWAIIRVVQHFV